MIEQLLFCFALSNENNFASDTYLSIHFCSAGVGRTGTYIALDALLQQAKLEGVIDVPGCINRLREDRINMVQTLVGRSFVKFIADFMIWFTKNTSLQCRW